MDLMANPLVALTSNIRLSKTLVTLRVSIEMKVLVGFKLQVSP